MKEDLSPLISDTAFIAIIHTQPTPFVFIMKKCGLPIRDKLAIYLIEKMDEMSTVSPNFFIYKDVLYTGEMSVLTGEAIDSKEAVKRIKEGHLKIKINSQEIYKSFLEKKYDPFLKQVNAYNKFMTLCEDSLNINEALERFPLSTQEWKSLKSLMNKYSLYREPRFAINVKINGSLAIFLHRQFGHNLNAEVARILSKAITKPD